MNDEHVQEIVAEVISRLAARLGADGSRGTVIAVFTGATVAFGEAIQQVRALILDGYRIQLVFSQAAEQLFARAVTDELRGFPHVNSMEPTKWLSVLKQSRAVVVPLLSVNTVSKLSMLIADNLATNLILHALFMGKTVVASQNGADPTGRGREELGFTKGTPALRDALTKRLRTLTDYGCHLSDVKGLRDTLNSSISGSKGPIAVTPDQTVKSFNSNFSHSEKMLTATDIRYAHHLGVNLRISSATLVTPLARDLAMRYGVALSGNNES